MTAPRVLLVYANPAITATPVAPYGMERVAQAFRMAGCETRMLTPFIEADAVAALQAALAWQPDLVGFSVRNVDDALVVRTAEQPDVAGPWGPELDTTFYLDEVEPLVAAAIAAVGEARVVLGGAAVSSAPEAVTRYLGASWAIAGPADDLCWRLGRALATGGRLEPDPRIVQVGAAGPLDGPRPAPGPPHDPVVRPRRFADAWRPVPGPTPRLGPWLGLALTRGGRVPVQIAAGCDRRCHFCVEARFTGHMVRARPVDEIMAELDSLVAVGLRRFWLATSELNVPDERHALAVLDAIARRYGDQLDLSAFLQAAPVSDDLLDALEAVGIDPTTLSFELGHLHPALLRAGAGPANRAQIDALVERFLRRGYGTLGGSVLLGAHPLETWETLDSALDTALELDDAFPDGLGLAYATGARVYPRTWLADWIAAHRDEAAPWLHGADDPSFVRPVVYSRPAPPRALLAHVFQHLAEARGQMGPMNSEAPEGPDELAAEALVNRGIHRLQEDRAPEAAAAFTDALALAPAHLEALAQLAQVQANALGDAQGAIGTLQRLLAALPAGDPRRGEIVGALQALSA
ncbi:MAG: cobalamin B12-binding domain-containing protein [Alphaproteobacteria bacterium]|nr:cobalamin B12-binding domain-containing protein [Alphaproteobacteria bacterium]